MYQHVSSEFKRSTELFLANLACDQIEIYFVGEFLVLLQSLLGGIGFLTINFFAHMFQVSIVDLDVILQIVFVVKLFPALGTEVLIICSLLVNISQVFDQVLPEEEFFVADAAGNVEVALGAMLLPHVAVQLATVGEAHWRVVQVTHNASVSDLSTWVQKGVCQCQGLYCDLKR
jgi:hypothetical protein